jgi:hypothetical protein
MIRESKKNATKEKPRESFKYLIHIGMHTVSAFLQQPKNACFVLFRAEQQRGELRRDDGFERRSMEQRPVLLRAAGHL